MIFLLTIMVVFPAFYYKQRTIDFFIVCFVEDPPVISFWCCYFSFLVDQFFFVIMNTYCVYFSSHS
jgi:hypothetical protein